MFGTNPISRIENNNDGRTLHVVKGSPFRTLQGEGPFAGHPATFIRLHGCNLRCTFCDTQFSDPDDPWIDIADLALKSQLHGYRLVVITGGEPMRQNILPLCRLLHAAKFLVQIETAGTIWIDDIQEVAKIIVSPKTPTLNPMAKKYAMAFKYIISSLNLHDGFIPITATQPGATPKRLASPRAHAPVYLSPCDEYDDTINQANRKLVGDLAMKYDVIGGLQLHKFMGLD